MNPCHGKLVGSAQARRSIIGTGWGVRKIWRQFERSEKKRCSRSEQEKKGGSLAKRAVFVREKKNTVISPRSLDPILVGHGGAITHM